MDLDAGIDARPRWRVKLKAAISRGGMPDASTITQATRCELGRWLNGAGRSPFGTRPEFLKLVTSHRAFHAAAGKAASAVNAGRTADAESLLDGPFQAQSYDTVAAIQACRKACR
jgi:hypothetical protein